VLINVILEEVEPRKTCKSKGEVTSRPTINFEKFRGERREDLQKAETGLQADKQLNLKTTAPKGAN
jgi:hypothetical protein